MQEINFNKNVLRFDHCYTLYNDAIIYQICKLQL